MSRKDRAKQFAPFDALKGLRQALKMKEYEHDRILKSDLSEEKVLELSNTLLSMKKGDLVKVIYFFDGYYKKITGKTKIEIDKRILSIEKVKINFDDIFDLKIVN